MGNVSESSDVSPPQALETEVSININPTQVENFSDEVAMARLNNGNNEAFKQAPHLQDDQGSEDELDAKFTEPTW